MSPSTKQYTYQKNDKKEYFCVTCKFTTPNQNTMHYHYKTHDEKKEYECDKCNKSFTAKQTLDNHIRAKHTKEKELWECTKCDFKNLTKGNCRIHYVRMHCKSKVEKILDETDNGFACKTCNKTYKGATSFYYHAYDCLQIKKNYCELADKQEASVTEKC